VGFHFEVWFGLEFAGVVAVHIFRVRKLKPKQRVVLGLWKLVGHRRIEYGSVRGVRQGFFPLRNERLWLVKLWVVGLWLVELRIDRLGGFGTRVFVGFHGLGKLDVRWWNDVGQRHVRTVRHGTPLLRV
jgi:hypothetical protein